MNNITSDFEEIYVPKKALMIYQTLATEPDTFVEAYDIDQKGFPVNAHLLTDVESISLAQSLASSKELKNNYMQCSGLLPENLLFIDLNFSGYAVWYTPPQKVSLYFKDQLAIPCGQAFIPALIWKADKDKLWVFAHKGNAKPRLDSPLFYAPFFNIHSDGEICMGNVEVDFSKGYFLEEFILKWQQNFFNSYFSHGLAGHKPAKSNIVQLWNSLIGSPKKFPQSQLEKTRLTLKSILK